MSQLLALALTVAAASADEPTPLAVRQFIAELEAPVADAGADEPCAFARVAGRQQGVLCHGIMYDLTVPAQCLEDGRRCGVVVHPASVPPGLRAASTARAAAGRGDGAAAC